MYRILAIDYGSKRIGLALSDPLCIIAKPYATLENISFEQIFEKLALIIREQAVGKIVLGLPYNLMGEDSHKTSEVREFHRLLCEKITVPIELCDERFSTADANSELKKMGYSIKDSKKVVDQVAAALILRSYLDNTHKS